MGYLDEAQLRRQQIQQRLADLELRIEALSARRGQLARLPTRKGSTRGQRQRAHASQLAAQEQLAASVEGLFRALMFAAEAHDRAAIVHEQLAARGVGDVAGHQRRALDHRMASRLDLETAEDARPMLGRRVG